MSNSRATPSDPGWYPDPAGGGSPAWWNGSSWGASEYVPAGGQSPQQPAPPPLATPQRYTQATIVYSPRVAPYTWQLWLIVLLPLIPAIGIGFIDVPTLIMSSISQAGAFSDPGYALVQIGSLVIGIATIFLAFGDSRSLQRRGLEKPFHPAFIFLGGVIYVIGRSVVVKREIGSGLTPIWASLGVIMISFATTMILVTKISDVFGPAGY